jgi:hypothetical protein
MSAFILPDSKDIERPSSVVANLVDKVNESLDIVARLRHG